jgi:hypothetical protein
MLIMRPQRQPSHTSAPPPHPRHIRPRTAHHHPPAPEPRTATLPTPTHTRAHTNPRRSATRCSRAATCQEPKCSPSSTTTWRTWSGYCRSRTHETRETGAQRQQPCICCCSSCCPRCPAAGGTCIAAATPCRTHPPAPAPPPNPPTPQPHPTHHGRVAAGSLLTAASSWWRASTPPRARWRRWTRSTR